MELLKATDENFQYQQSAEKAKSYKLRNSKRKRLFENENASDDEVDHVDKKAKIVKPPVNGQMIFKSYQCKEYEKCLEMIEEIMKQKPKQAQKEDAMYTQYKIIQAACWTMMDINKDKIADQLMTIIKKEPRNSFAHYGYGLYQYHEGKMSAAIESFGKAIDLNPTGAMKRAMELKAKAKNLMDMLCDAKSHYEKNSCSRAVDMLNAAALIDPENRKMIRTIVDMRDFFVKDLVLRLEREIEIDFPDKFRDAEKLMVSNQLIKAEKVVNEINVEEPNTARAFYIKGLHFYLTGSLKEAHKLFLQALEINGTMEKAVKMEAKAKTLLELFEKASQEMNDKNYPAAIETFTKAIEFDTDNKFICQASHFQRALANFNIGNFDAAFEDYKSFESMKKVVGNVLQDIEVPNTANEKREKAEKAEKEEKAKKLNKKKKRKGKKFEVKEVTKLQTLPEEDEFEHDSLCAVNDVENKAGVDQPEVENMVENKEAVVIADDDVAESQTIVEIDTEVKTEKKVFEIINDEIIQPIIEYAKENEVIQNICEVENYEILPVIIDEVPDISQQLQNLSQSLTTDSNCDLMSQDYGAIEDEVLVIEASAIEAAAIESSVIETPAIETLVIGDTAVVPTEKIKEEEVEMKNEPTSPTEEIAIVFPEIKNDPETAESNPIEHPNENFKEFDPLSDEEKLQQEEIKYEA